MFTSNHLSEKVFDLVDPFGEILSALAWDVHALYNSTTNATPAQLVFGRDMLFNLIPFFN